MYAKYVNETAILFPPYEKDGVINYNSDTNSEQLLRDSYLTFIDSDNSGELKNPQKRYKIENNKIIAYFVEGETSLSSDEELKYHVCQVRDAFLVQYVDNRAKSPFQWAEVSEEEKTVIGEYRVYLLDYTKSKNWWLQNPLTYDEWIKAKYPNSVEVARIKEEHPYPEQSTETKRF